MELKKESIIDYSVTACLVFSILFYVFSKLVYKSAVLSGMVIIFFSYWMIRIIFSPKHKDLISGN